MDHREQVRGPARPRTGAVRASPALPHSSAERNLSCCRRGTETASSTKSDDEPPASAVDPCVKANAKADAPEASRTAPHRANAHHARPRAGSTDRPAVGRGRSGGACANHASISISHGRRHHVGGWRAPCPRESARFAGAGPDGKHRIVVRVREYMVRIRAGKRKARGQLQRCRPPRLQSAQRPGCGMTNAAGKRLTWGCAAR